LDQRFNDLKVYDAALQDGRYILIQQTAKLGRRTLGAVK
jgi:hypothetical protein